MKRKMKYVPPKIPVEPHGTIGIRIRPCDRFQIESYPGHAHQSISFSFMANNGKLRNISFMTAPDCSVYQVAKVLEKCAREIFKDLRRNRRVLKKGKP